jgi:ribosome-associated toxin RatA of RatAB toxin-antitoxin module
MATRVSTSVKIMGGHRKELVFEKVKRLEDYPRFMPDVKEVNVLESGLKGGVSEWHVEIDGCPLYWKERDTFDRSQLLFRFDTIEGDFEFFTGQWEVLDSAGDTEVIFSVEYSVGIPVIEEIIGPILAAKMEKNTLKMLTDLKREVEAMASQDARAAQRVPTWIETVVQAGAKRYEALVRDLSDGGAAIEVAGQLAGGEAVEFLLEHNGEACPVRGEVVWFDARKHRAGLRLVKGHALKHWMDVAFGQLAAQAA